jgi:hypothetical protein
LGPALKLFLAAPVPVALPPPPLSRVNLALSRSKRLGLFPLEVSFPFWDSPLIEVFSELLQSFTIFIGNLKSFLLPVALV